MSVHNPEIKIGCDPELFLRHRTTKEFVSAHDMVPGFKHQPFIVQKGAVQCDGTSAEFNIEPATTANEFVGNIRTVLETLSNIVEGNNPDLQLYVTPTAVFDMEYFKYLPAEAKAFGCTPDFNAYTGKVQSFNPTKEPFRTGAGHIHVGWTEGEDEADSSHMFDCIEAVKQLDSVLYLLSLLWDPDGKRRTLYGKIGSFRPKSYGVEYRPLSNMFIADPELQAWVFNATQLAMGLLDRKDVKLWNIRSIKNKVSRAREGKGLTRAEIIGHHRFLVEEGFAPPLPGRYLV